MEKEAIKRQNCLINQRFSSIPVHVHTEKKRKNTSEETSGEKPTQVPKGIAEAIRAERTRQSR